MLAYIDPFIIRIDIHRFHETDKGKKYKLDKNKSFIRLKIDSPKFNNDEGTFALQHEYRY